MFKEGYSFPHPVLGNEDDIQGELNASLDFEGPEQKKIVIRNVHIDVTNEYFRTLIARNLAEVVLKIYCSSTFTSWILTHPFEDVRISEDDLANKADVQVFIVATEKIESFEDASFHPQFAGQRFQIDRGETIGISSKIGLPIGKQHERLGLGNIFKFCHHENQKPMYFEYNRDKIFINYPVTAKGTHPPRVLFDKTPWAAFNMFIIPALAEALRLIANNSKEVNDLEWFQVIDNLLPESERNDNYFQQAQQLLNTQLPILLAHDELIA